jgi:Abnormal spindle-like microcephaly-assoc'd, ASPM-SPD-2-Hydin
MVFMRALPLTALALLLFSLAPAGLWSQQLQCDPCSHHFGKVEVGLSKSFSIKLTNSGTKSLSILSKSKQGGEFKFGHFPLPITLAPGKTVLFPIVFQPTAIGHVTGSFTLVSTAVDTSLSMPVAGTGSPLLTVTPSTLNFGNVSVGKSATLAATFSASKGNVIISSDQFNSSEFSIGGLTLPVTIPSGHSIQAKLRFTPNQAGTAYGKVGYFSNAVPSPAVEQLSGNGVATGSHSAGLTWHEGDPTVVGYNIYRGTAHGGPYKQINTALEASTNYTDFSVAAGTTYYYVTTAVNGAGQQSIHSNEAKAVIPNP